MLVHHDGRREMLIYDVDDPDACSSVLKLSHDDTRTLNELLGATQVTEEVHETQHELNNQSIAWIVVPPNGSIAGTTIGAGQFRERTGACVVAVIRGDDPYPSPEADFALQGDDLVVAVGPASTLDALRAVIRP